ncbi:hypothetical protein LZ30DRAFT_145917 [Colletotrichum cereale]|nr:hypothetical protein LZ30DRAFT_145917 [Colletotrichum cereale]
MVRRIVPLGGQTPPPEPKRPEPVDGVELPLRPPVTQVFPEQSIPSDEPTLRCRCDVCPPPDHTDRASATQYVDIKGQGSTRIDGMVAGKNSFQMVRARGQGNLHITGMVAGHGSTQVVSTSDDEDILSKMLGDTLAPRNASRQHPEHLQPAQIEKAMPIILDIANEQGTRPVFGGLQHRQNNWECFLFNQYQDKNGMKKHQCKGFLGRAGIDLETWICLEIFASLLAHCAEREDQTTLCPNWLWARQEAIFGRERGRPKAVLEEMRSMIRQAPVCPVRVGVWATSCLVEIWRAARNERHRGMEQDLRTFWAVQGCFLNEMRNK